MRKLFIILFLFIGVVQAQTTYYIDPAGTDGGGHTGLIADPWVTLSYACTQVTTSGDIIHVNAGTYTETANCNVSVGVSIEGVGVTSHIDFTHAATDYTDASIRLVSGSEGTDGNQSISYLYLDGNSQASYHGVLVKCRSNVLIHHCTFINFRYNAVHFNGKLAGYVTGVPPASTWATGNQLYNCTITNCSNILYNYNETGHGNIRFTGQSGLLIHDNTITQTGAAANYNANIVDAVEGCNKGCKYYNNISYKPDVTTTDWNFHLEEWYIYGGYEVYGNEFHGGEQGFDVGGCVKGSYLFSAKIYDNLFQFSAKRSFVSRTILAINLENVATVGTSLGDVKDVSIYNNHVQNLPYGINMTSIVGTTDFENIDIHCNIFENMGFNPSDWCFVFKIEPQGDMTNVYVYNNVIHSSTTGQSMCSFYFNPSGIITDFYVKNNIILNDNASIGPIYAEDFAGTFTNLHWNYNDFYNNGVNLIYYAGAKRIINFLNTNNINGDPLFVGGSPYDFNLQAGSPAITAGIGVGLTTDYAGNAWATTPSIGAYEYDSDPPDPPGLPEVETGAVIYTAVTANVSYEVTSNGGGTLTNRGVCYSLSTNPTTSDRKTVYTSSLGSFTDVLRGLHGGVTYHARAYTINESGTSYGADISFTTLAQSIIKNSTKTLRLTKTVIIR
jgi:hypothetical protein